MGILKEVFCFSPSVVARVKKVSLMTMSVVSAWVGLVRLQPDFRIHIKWWVVLFVDFFLQNTKKNKKAISMHSEFGYFL